MKEEQKRRIYGEHFTPTQIFNKYIKPYIKDIIYDYKWVDLFAGVGNLILPILDMVPENKRVHYFKEHIFLYDIYPEYVNKAIEKAIQYGIPREIAEKNIKIKDTLEAYPKEILKGDFPVYHITNPPYLYLGYIVKNKEAQKHLKYFKGLYTGYQDLYQIALINDSIFGIKQMIYIIPANFLFGSSVSNKIRKDFLKFYKINNAYIFEKEIFKYTGTNVIICFFEKKKIPKDEILQFKAIKINNKTVEREYKLSPKNKYKAGEEFDEFVNNFVSSVPLKVKFYLDIKEIQKNRGRNIIFLIDANDYKGTKYKKIEIGANNRLYDEIKNNILFIRTVDTGSIHGKVGLLKVKDIYGVDGILVTKNKYRTHPIQLFFSPKLSIEDQKLLSEYFNFIIEYFRILTDSEFMTTYKYSDGDYTRKYLGLTQTKKLIETFPILELSKEDKNYFRKIVLERNFNKLLSYLKGLKDKRKERGLRQWI
jgi:hypothetical protein